jgi:hypothetical protein
MMPPGYVLAAFVIGVGFSFLERWASGTGNRRVVWMCRGAVATAALVAIAGVWR